MRLALGLLLVAVALVGGYFILIGKFPPSVVAGAQEPIGQAAAAASGGAQEPIGQVAQQAGVGSGGASVIGRVTHLGIPTFLHEGDMHVSRGGMR